MSRILKQKEAIQVALSGDRSASHLVPTWQDLDVFTSIDKALSLIQELTDTLSAEQYVTVSAIMPVIRLTRSKILRAKASETDHTKALKQKIIEDLVHHYQNEEVSSLLDLTSILDPRFKVKYV